MKKIQIKRNENIFNDSVYEVFVSGEKVGDLCLYQDEREYHTFIPTAGNPIDYYDIDGEEAEKRVIELCQMFFNDTEDEEQQEEQGTETRTVETQNGEYSVEVRDYKNIYSNNCEWLPVDITGETFEETEKARLWFEDEIIRQYEDVDNNYGILFYACGYDGQAQTETSQYWA